MTTYLPTEKELKEMGFVKIWEWSHRESGISYNEKFGFELHTVLDGVSLYPHSRSDLEAIIRSLTHYIYERHD